MTHARAFNPFLRRGWRVVVLRSSCRLAAMCGVALLLGMQGAVPAFAQGSDIRIQTPTLPPRSNAPGQSASAPPPSPSYQPPAPTQGQGPTPAAAPGQYGSQPQGVQTYGGGPAMNPAYGNQPYATAAPSLAVPSPMAARRMDGAAAWGAASQQPDPTQAVAALGPQAASKAEGACRAQISPDRQSITLLGADALPRTHIPLGEFRAQTIFVSPNGLWAVAITKLRGADEFGAMTIDLGVCKSMDAVGLSARASDVEFGDGFAVLQLPNSKQRISLASPRGR